MFFRFVNAMRKAIDLDFLYHGADAFLVGGGPQTAHVAARLENVFTAVMNNAAAVVRPDIWIGADEPECFSESILVDPSYLKIACISRHNLPIRPGKQPWNEIPNTIFVSTTNDQLTKEFFSRQRDFAWWRNVFTLSLQILHRLGFKRVFTVGCGFKAIDPYCFKSNMNEAKLKYNRGTYDMVIRHIEALMPFLEKADFELISCTPDSRLNDLVPYQDLSIVLKHVEMESVQHDTVNVRHPIDDPRNKQSRTSAEFPQENLPPKIGRHYLMALEHRKTILRALPPGGRMLEYGCGDSTLWFKANMDDDQELVSIEHDRHYAKITGAHHVYIKPGTNATRQEEALVPNWENYVNAPAKNSLEKYDVILVDGVLRTACLMAAPAILKKGGTVFLHDAHRDWYDYGRALYPCQHLYEEHPDYPKTTLWQGKLAV